MQEFVLMVRQDCKQAKKFFTSLEFELLTQLQVLNHTSFTNYEPLYY